MEGCEYDRQNSSLLKDVCILILTTHAYVTLYGKGNLQMQLN
jgi:hypothetical protein